MTNAGIYLLTIHRTDKLPLYYVGQSIDVRRRRGQHLTAARAGTHFNPRLNSAVAVYGEEAVTFEVLESCTAEQLGEFEAWWLSALVGHRRVLNVAAVPGHPNAGRELTPEHCQRIADAIRGEKHYLFGKAMPTEHRAKISSGGRGKKKPASYGASLSARVSGPGNPMAGKPSPKRFAIAARDAAGRVEVFASMVDAEAAGYLQSAISHCLAGRVRTHSGRGWGRMTEGASPIFSDDRPIALGRNSKTGRLTSVRPAP